LIFNVTPPIYFDPTEGLNGSGNGWVTPCSGIYKVTGRLRMQSVATTVGIQVFIKAGGNTFAAPITYGNTSPDQMVDFSTECAVFTPLDEITIEVARVGTGSVTIVGDTNLCYTSIELK